MLPHTLRSSLLLAALPYAWGADLSLPTELFSPLIAQKVLKTAQTVQSPPKYPQYTDRVQGVWEYFNPDTWTSGFFPATAYLLNARKDKCGADDDNGLGGADWLELGRAMSAGLVPLEDHTTQGHDVGFLSFPFIEELKVYVGLRECPRV